MTMKLKPFDLKGSVNTAPIELGGGPSDADEQAFKFLRTQLPSFPAAREVYTKELANNPKFVEAPKSGEAFAIVGAKPSVPR
jgi:hypothetical protein